MEIQTIICTRYVSWTLNFQQIMRKA